MDSEVIVVGAGPAGAALAAGLAARGRHVTLIDRSRFPRDKTCGECVSPGAIAHLDALGVTARVTAVAAPYRGLRLVDGRGRFAEARYPGGAAGMTLPRLALDQLLVERAVAASTVTPLFGVAVSGLVREGPAVAGVELADGTRLTARVVVAADGRYSPVSRLAFGPDHRPAARRFCFLNTFHGGTGSDDMLECGLVAAGLQYLRVYQGEGRYSVCLVVDEAHREAHAPGTLEGFMTLALAQPRLAERLAGATPADQMKGMPLAPYHPPRLVADGLLLAGDAVGYMDPITGEGMCRAFASAALAAETLHAALGRETGLLSAGSLARYEHTLRAEFAGIYRFVALAVRLTTLPPPLAALVVAGLGAAPPLATALASVQGALVPPSHLLIPPAWRPRRIPGGVSL